MGVGPPFSPKAPSLASSGDAWVPARSWFAALKSWQPVPLAIRLNPSEATLPAQSGLDGAELRARIELPTEGATPMKADGSP